MRIGPAQWIAKSKGPGRSGAALVAAAALLVAGCGGGGGGGGGGRSTSPVGPPNQPGFVGNDFDPPAIDVTSPDRGECFDAQSAPGRLIIVEGAVLDAGSGVDTLTINGQPALLGAGGAFRELLAVEKGANAVVLVARDKAGNEARSVRSVVWSERYEPPGTPIEKSLGARAAEGALNALAPAVVSAVEQSGTVQQQLLNGGQPIWQDYVSWPVFGGCMLSIQVTIDAVSYTNPTLRFDCRPGELVATYSVRDLLVAARADDWCGTPWFEVTGNLTADEVHFTLGLDAGVDPQSGRVKLVATTSDVTFINYDVDFTNLPGQIIGVFPVASAIRGPIEDALEDALATDLPPLIEQELDNLLQPISRTWNGRTVTFTLVPTDVRIDADGIDLEAKSNVTTSASAGAPAVAGSYFDPTHGLALPVFAPVQPNMSVALLSNAWNRALYTSWQAGFWNVRIDQAFLNSVGAGVNFSLNAGLLAGYIPGFQTLVNANQNVPVAFETEMLAQPILLPDPIGPDHARLSLPELHLRVLMDFGSGWTTIWEFACHAEAGVVFTIVNGNQIAVSIGGSPRFEVELLQSAVPLGGIDLGRFLTFLLPSVIQVVGRSIAPLQLPQVGPQNVLMFNAPVVLVEGPQDEYIGAHGDL